MNDDKRRREDDKEVRANEILAAALKESAKHGYMLITMGQIATAAGCARTLVSAYFGEMQFVRQWIMRHAVKVRDTEVLLQGFAIRDAIALQALQQDETLRIAVQNRLDLDT